MPFRLWFSVWQSLENQDSAPCLTGRSVLLELSSLRGRHFALQRSWVACAACGFARQARCSFVSAALLARGFAIRRSLGRLRGARQGGAGYGAAPPSLPPLHPPRSTPKEGFQFPSCGEGNAAFAAGASLPRSARSGDLPPRRVNAKGHFCLGCYSASAINR